MSDKIRAKLQEFADVMEAAHDWPDTDLVKIGDLAKEARALLSEQPQAKPCTKLDCFPFCDCGGVDDDPQASAAQSAPAGEREAFEADIRRLYPSEYTHLRLLRRIGEDYQESYIVTRWGGWQAGAAWQRTQSAGVPKGWRLVPVVPTPEMAKVSTWDMNSFYSASKVWAAMLAAAPAQPAAQGEFGDAYQGAREDLAIWKRRALEAEARVRTYDQRIVDLGALGMGTAHEKGQEVRRLRAALEKARTQLQLHAEEASHPGQYALIAEIDATLAASTGQEVKP